MPVLTTRVGRLILVDAPEPGSLDLVVVYARVSSAEQRADLDRQVARVTTWAGGNGLAVTRIVTEVGSALNGKRRRFLALLRDPKVRLQNVPLPRGRTRDDRRRRTPFARPD